MSAIRVKLVRGLAACPAKQRLVVRGLGLKKVDSTKLLPDTPQTLGMIGKVSHLVTWERVDEAPPIGRLARKKAAAEAKAGRQPPPV
jgi:large subunit ribosomal protein L30